MKMMDGQSRQATNDLAVNENKDRGYEDLAFGYLMVKQFCYLLY